MRYLLLIIGVLGLAGCVAQPVVSARQEWGVPVDQDCNKKETSETTPISRFQIDEAAGMVFDFKTKLTWKRCSEGQTYNLEHCQGKANEWTWDQAVTQFGVDGAGWRLPNVDELSSTVEMRCRQATLSSVLFPDTDTDTLLIDRSYSLFWSGSPESKPSPNAWFVGDSGMALVGAKTTRGFLRLVRGEQWIDPSGILGRERNQAEAQKANEAQARKKTEAKEARDAEERRQRDLKQKKEEEEVRRKIAELLDAEKSAALACPDKTACDKAFSLTQIYLNQTADMKIQVATDTIVETYNPTEEGKLGLKAIRVPGKGASARIVLIASCKDEKGTYVEVCRQVKLRAYQGFRPFIDQMLKS